MALEGNQGILHDVVCLFLYDSTAAVLLAVQVSKGPGRAETHVASISDDVGWLRA